MLALPPAPLLPATLGKLTRLAEGDAGDGLGGLDAAGLNAQEKAVVAEDGLKRFAQSGYAPAAASNSKGSAAATATVTVFKFGDASGAVAAYDYLRKPDMKPEKLGDAAVADAQGVLLRSGVNVVRADARLGHDAMLALTRELIDHLPKVSGTAAIAPLLPDLLPAKGLDGDSVHYVLGPVTYAATGGVLSAETLGFDKSAEAVTGRYRSGGVLTLLLYPTPQIAGDHARAAASELERQGANAGTVRVRREGPLVAVTSGAWSAAAAQATIDGIHLRQELSFDKPMPHEFHAEVAKTYSLLSSIFLFCGIGAVAAIVLGLFLGGGRAAIRVLQGKPAASEPEFLRIDLRGPVGGAMSPHNDPKQSE